MKVTCFLLLLLSALVLQTFSLKSKIRKENKPEVLDEENVICFSTLDRCKRVKDICNEELEEDPLLASVVTYKCRKDEDDFCVVAISSDSSLLQKAIQWYY